MKNTFLKGLALVSTIALAGLASCAPHEHVGGTATCTDLAICEECGEAYGELLPHEHTTVKFDETNHWDECVCGDKINVTAHNWVAGEITKAPTCTEDGTQAYSCTCGATKTEVVPAEGHDHSITEYDEENHWLKCECGDITAVTPHTWVAGEITVAPKCTTEGKQAYSCDCGATKEETLPSLGGHIDEDQDVYCDREGCTSKVIKPQNTEVTLDWAFRAIKTNVSLGKYYVRGTVSSIKSATNGQLYITDGTSQLYVNLIKGENGESYVNLPQRACVGDVIKVYGQLKKDTSTQEPSIYSCTMEVIEHTHVWGEATCTKPAECICGMTTGEPKGHHDSDDEGTLCDVCGIDVTLTAQYLKLETADPNIDKSITNTLRWDSEDYKIHFSLSKGTATNSLYTTSNDHIRMYKNNNFTVFSTLPNMIHRVTFHMPLTTNADGVTKFSTIFTALGHEVEINGTEVSVNFVASDRLVFTNTTGSTQKLIGVTVFYK